MLDKLQAIEDKYLDLEAKISDPDIIAEEFKLLEDSFVRCISCFEPQTPEDNSVVCKRCLSRLHQDDPFLDLAREYGLH